MFYKSVSLGMATMKNLSMAPIGRYIDPLTDFGFKRIFGSEPHKDLLIAFLNALFNGRKVIRDLVYNPQESDGPAKHYRKTIFDLTCKGMEGETFIIEMQRADQRFFTDRAIFYAASKLYAQGPKGNKHWSFELKEVYFIGLIDFKVNHTRPEKYLHYARLVDEETGEAFYKKLEFIFLELPNFNLEEETLKTDLEYWMYALKNMAKLEKIPVTLCQKTFQQLFKIAEVANLKKEEYMLYQKAVLDKWTEYSVLKTAEEKGLEMGLEKGAEQKSYEVVYNLLSATDFDIAKIAALAGVTEPFVKKIKASLKEKK